VLDLVRLLLPHHWDTSLLPGSSFPLPSHPLFLEAGIYSTVPPLAQRTFDPSLMGVAVEMGIETSAEWGEEWE